MTGHCAKILDDEDEKHAHQSHPQICYSLVELFSDQHTVTQMSVCSSWCPKPSFHTLHRFLERQKERKDRKKQ